MSTAEDPDPSSRDHRALVDFAATTPLDLYGLLNLEPPTFAQDDSAPGPTADQIKKAYRRAALTHHPDKNPSNPTAAASRLHECTQALEVLRDVAARGRYDERRRVEGLKVERERLFQGRRREMREELERRESGNFNFGEGVGKRKREGEDEREKKEREVRRLAEEGARRREIWAREREERRQKEVDTEGLRREDELEREIERRRREKAERRERRKNRKSEMNGRDGLNGGDDESVGAKVKSSFKFSPEGRSISLNGGAGLYERTMARMKEAEKRRLEEMIRREEAGENQVPQKAPMS